MGRFGVDVSSNNVHPIAWGQLFAYLKARGGETPFAIVKVSQGTGYTNPDAKADIAAARAVGFIVGGYLMDQGNDAPASEEALFRADSAGVPQFDDDELPEGLGTKAYIAHLQSLVAVADVPQYLNQSEEDEGYPVGAGVWEANYNNEPGVTHRPGVLIHQFTSAGEIPGVDGEFDLNYWTGSEAQFSRFFGVTAPVTTDPAPPPSTTYEEDDMQSIPVDVAMAGGKGWIPSPVPAAKVINIVMLTENPDVVGRYDSVPIDWATASQAGPHSPNGALVVEGLMPDGTYGAVIWAAS